MSSGSSIIKPTDPGYEKAVFAYDLHPQTPAAACVPTTVAEVQEAIGWARENGLTVAAQSTGHRAVGLPPLDDSLLIRPMINTEPVIDAKERIARVGAGTTWDSVVNAAAEHGLAAMHGSSPTVGVVGYTVGGGLSFYGREHGLACNKVRAIEVVTGEGEVARVDADHEPDLFWALRGAGGWASVVTAIEFELLPYREIFGGASFWPVEASDAVLSTWLDWTRSAPESVTTSFRIMNMPPIEEVPEPIRGQNLVAIDGVATDQGDGQALVAQLDGIAEPLMAQWGQMPAPAASRLHGDPEDPVPAIGAGGMVDGLDEEAVAAFVEAAGGESGSALLAAELRQLGGQLRRPDDSGGVADHIDAEFVSFGVGMAADPAGAAKTQEDLGRLMGALEPWAGKHRFLNFSNPDSSCQQCFGDDSTEALKAIRHEYDPDGLIVPPIAL
ncbi:MAG: FAD-binding oxidoreductase [Solirubrobacterales bacterium]|nr:FAD-binding oxidoreductase [Solirubrobacterales bacterium]